MNRSELRENIFKLLFLSDFNRAEEMPEQLTLYFDGLDMRRVSCDRQDQDYMEGKYTHVKEKIDLIDEALNEASSGWKTGRMSKVDLNVLRLAVYEARYDEDIPERVAINEAVELAKRFGGDNSASFVNGILGKIFRRAEAVQQAEAPEKDAIQTSGEQETEVEERETEASKQSEEQPEA